MSLASVLTLNAGSSSIKFGLFDITGDAPRPRATGMVENIAGAARLRLETEADKKTREVAGVVDHEGALREILRTLTDGFADARILAVGHRVVHGGPAHDAPARLTEGVMEELERLAPFAPLHQPHNLAGVRAAMGAFPEATQVACFDTAFHRKQPWVNDVFALPREYYDKGVRRYGFHGLSYEYISGELARIAPHLHSGRVIVAHLGNGASMCALLGGRSVGSTMGFSALDGLPMGTRCGQLDPGALLYLMEQEGMDAASISDLLYKRSGLLGLSGLSNDMRALEASDTPEAAQAIDYFVFRIRRELGALAAVLGGLDALVFCGGIGENARSVRARVCEGMGWLGLDLDHAANAANARVISAELSRARALVIPTDEEVVIARAAQGFCDRG